MGADKAEGRIILRELRTASSLMPGIVHLPLGSLMVPAGSLMPQSLTLSLSM
jgi:hypothetical protein